MVCSDFKWHSKSEHFYHSKSELQNAQISDIWYSSPHYIKISHLFVIYGKIDGLHTDVNLRGSPLVLRSEIVLAFCSLRTEAILSGHNTVLTTSVQCEMSQIVDKFVSLLYLKSLKRFI